MWNTGLLTGVLDRNDTDVSFATDVHRVFSSRSFVSAISAALNLMLEAANPVTLACDAYESRQGHLHLGR